VQITDDKNPIWLQYYDVIILTTAYSSQKMEIFEKNVSLSMSNDNIDSTNNYKDYRITLIIFHVLKDENSKLI